MICVDLWVHPAQILQGQPARTLAMAEASRRHELRAARVHHKVVLAPPNGGVPDAVGRLIDGVFEAKMFTSVKTYIVGGDVKSFDNNKQHPILDKIKHNVLGERRIPDRTR